ncbi:hypothetical protein MSAN_01954900 [Mycena sanguinolenta]|uniref:Uncharacterized protein n=1 Tax=Mycena sanguinolenta TaxID=230812 RepID=A0A8H6XL97_9AGAR|nr:hypothetical protein MSAN_01954900 [Mycena sanguinolenta]
MARRRGCRLRAFIKPIVWSFVTSYGLYSLARYISATPPAFLSHEWLTHLETAVIWVGSKILHGLIVLTFIPAIFTLSSVIRDIRRWLTSAPAGGPTPAELESAQPAPIPPPYETGYNLVAFLFCTFSIVGYFSTLGADIVSADKLPLENISACLMFLLRGLEILFVGLIAVRVVLWFRDVCLPTVGRDIELEADVPHHTSEVALDDGDAPVEEELTHREGGPDGHLRRTAYFCDGEGVQ